MPIQIKRNIYAFGQTFLVACPQCSKQATLINRGHVAEPDIVLACSNCGFMQQWQQSYNEICLTSSWQQVGNHALVPAPTGYGDGDVCIWVETSPDTTQKSEGVLFRLWLQTPCNGENLWFLNSEHLAFTETYIQTPQQHRSRSFDTGGSREQLLWLGEWVKRIEDKGIIFSCLKELRLKS